MSQTRSVTSYNIRLLIDDLDPDDYAISSVRMNQYIQGQMHLLGNRMVLPMEAVTSVAVTGGTYDYTLTGTAGDVRQVFWNSTGQELDRLSFEDIVSQFLQDTSVSSTGTPAYYSLYETSAQASKLRLAPTPAASGTLKIYYGIIPAALTTDASTIPFSAPMLRVLEKMVARECLGIMGPDDLKRRMISKDVIPLWTQQIEQGISYENFRMAAMGSLKGYIQEVSY